MKQRLDVNMPYSEILKNIPNLPFVLSSFPVNEMNNFSAYIKLHDVRVKIKTQGC